MPSVTAASSCRRFCSLKTKDTVSGVLAGVVPKGTAPGTLAALIPGVTRTRVLLPGAVEALAAVAATGTAAITAPAASPAQRRKRTDLAILCSPYVSDTRHGLRGVVAACVTASESAPRGAQGAPSGQGVVYRPIFHQSSQMP